MSTVSMMSTLSMLSAAPAARTRAVAADDRPRPGNAASRRITYRVAKRAFDLAFSGLVLLPATALLVVALVVLNPAFNRGPLFYGSLRMGRGCRPFRA
jgi:lipopolysaccharide/colanic/teichoic acid biosynthesis glycosyltransferase